MNVDIPVRLIRQPGVISYRCDDGDHARCSGFVAPAGTLASLCDCQSPGCDCNARARTAS